MDEGSAGRDDEAQIRTFLIADVRGYTLFTNQRGDEAAGKLAAKFAELAEETIQARGGSLIELRGDEALAVFASARQAIRASLDLQARFVEETLADPTLPLPVGIGLDAGEAVPVAGGYRGGALNLAARLCGQAGPGEVLASAEVVHLARKIEGVTYIDRGAIELKGMEAPVNVMKVVPDGADPADLLKPALTNAPPPARRFAQRRSVVIAVIAILAVLVIIAVAMPLLRDEGAGEPLAGSGLQLLNASDGAPIGSLPVQGSPGGIAAGDGFIWMSDTQGETILKIDPDTRASVDTIDVGGGPSGLAFGDGSIWVVKSSEGEVARIDPATDRVVARIAVGNGPSAVAARDDAVWVTNFSDDSVTRIDPATSKAIDTISVGDGPTGVAADATGAWVTSINDGLLTRVENDGGSTTSIRVGNGPAGVAITAGGVWVANSLDGTLSRIDPQTAAITTTVPVGDGPTSVTVGNGSLWVAIQYGGSIAKVDPATAQVRSITVAGEPFASIVARNVVWVGTLASPTTHLGGTLMIGSEAPLDTIDPATAYFWESWAVLSMTNDGLVSYQRIGGPQGAAIVPDLATSIPRPSDGGKTLTFHLRSNISYSDGSPVRPEDFRLALERTFAQGSPLAIYYDKIVGAGACLATPASCDLSAGIAVDDDQGTVTFHLTGPDPELLYALAVPAAFAVPRGTPLTAIGTAPIPATGAYRIASFTPGGRGSIRLERNPTFEEWSRAAQPRGYTDTIEWTFGMSPDAQITAVEHGDLDYAADTPPAPRLRELHTRYPGQVFEQASSATWGFAMNVQTSPLDDVRVRQAVQFAVDRDRMIAGIGGKSLYAVTCQILPPDFPSYRPYCPYTIDPDAKGTWSGPDLAAAQRLVVASGTRGAEVSVWVPAMAAPGGREIARALSELGYRPMLHVVPSTGDFFGDLFNPANTIDIGFEGWGADFPAPSGFITPLLSCGTIPPHGGSTNAAHFCDAGVEQKIHRALAIQAGDPAAANTVWADIDRTIVDRSPWLAYANPRGVYFLSERVGNIEINPMWRLLLDQLWVH